MLLVQTGQQAHHAGLMHELAYEVLLQVQRMQVKIKHTAGKTLTKRGLHTKVAKHLSGVGLECHDARRALGHGHAGSASAVLVQIRGRTGPGGVGLSGLRRAAHCLTSCVLSGLSGAAFDTMRLLHKADLS